MQNLTYLDTFYLDKEKDIIVNLFREKPDEIMYILETPNHNTGNLITNLAKLCGLETTKNEEDRKIIKGVIPAHLNTENEEVYIFRLGGIKIANIYLNGKIEVKATIPAISKTLMSQTKNYSLDISKTIIKSYILKKLKFRTDVHTHMNANLFPDVLIALGIKHQMRYPLYYIKKLNLKMTKEQEEKIYEQRKIVEKQFEDSELTGKYLTRRIDDNTFINFADFILNNIENAKENIAKIRTSLSILKDGQAVFTNLEKLYLYRYVFCEGKKSEDTIELVDEKIKRIPERDVQKYVNQMLEDAKKGSPYENNSIIQDKILWIAREYKKQGIKYVEIANRNLIKKGEYPIKFLKEMHEILPKVEKETGVMIRFLVALRRVPLTIIKDQKTSENYLRENLDVLKAIAKDPYVVGSDIMGEEINDIRDIRPVIEELVQYVACEDNDFTIRVHAGENDSLRDNVANTIECIKSSLKEGQKLPRFRIGHGLYTADLDTKEGKELIKEMKETGVILEFQLTSNVRLNNLNSLKKHPLKTYLKENIKCVQGTDGCGFYGVDTIDEQLALYNLLELNDEDFEKMREVEEGIIEHSKKYFKEKSKKFQKLMEGKTFEEIFYELEEKYVQEGKKYNIEMRINNESVNVEDELKQKITKLPENKVPVVIAGGSFNAKNRKTELKEEGVKILAELIENIDTNKVYFVVGHKVQGYEKALIDIAKKLDKQIEIDAIVPKRVSKKEKESLLKKDINGICVSTETEELGIYKSFNYEIFERRKSIVIAFDGNSAVSNLVQEAKNGKAKSKIYVNNKIPSLHEKAKSLKGYVTPFDIKDDIVKRILEENPEITDNKVAI